MQMHLALKVVDNIKILKQ